VFRVGVTRDVRLEDGSSDFDFGLLDAAPDVAWDFLAEDVRELAPGLLHGYDAVVVFSPAVTVETLAEGDRPLLVARLGVGYDRVDVDACTERGVLLSITPDGVRRPLAAGAMAFVLTLAHRLPAKDREVRDGRWERFAHVGVGLTGRTLGLIGVGNIGRDVVRLFEPFGMRRIAYDPYVREPPEGVELVSLDTLMAQSDFVLVLCPLTDETRDLVDARRIGQMKRTAFLVNIARGPIVDQTALIEALRLRRIAGAALDVFEQEPVDPADPLLALDNVVLAPHAVGLTDETFKGSGQSASRAVLAAAEGRVPEFVVNPEALAHPRLRDRLAWGRTGSSGGWRPAKSCSARWPRS
jgi:phosphoglycerate dehydrogenase-like enzyme